MSRRNWVELGSEAERMLVAQGAHELSRRKVRGVWEICLGCDHDPDCRPDIVMAEPLYKWIDEASYEDMLRKVRYAPIGDELFQGRTGTYFLRVMARKGSEVGPTGKIAASKRIGWDG